MVFYVNVIGSVWIVFGLFVLGEFFIVVAYLFGEFDVFAAICVVVVFGYIFVMCILFCFCYYGVMNIEVIKVVCKMLFLVLLFVVYLKLMGWKYVVGIGVIATVLFGLYKIKMWCFCFVGGFMEVVK